MTTIVNRYWEANGKIEVLTMSDGSTIMAYYDSENLGGMYALLEVSEFYGVDWTAIQLTKTPDDLGWGPAQCLKARL